MDSADCYYETFDFYDPNDFRLEVRQNPKELLNSLFNDYHRLIPCWSDGRLMEIAHICSGSTLSYKEEAEELEKFKEEHKCETLIEAVILCINDAVSIGRLDFSKLED